LPPLSDGPLGYAWNSPTRRGTIQSFYASSLSGLLFSLSCSGAMGETSVTGPTTFPGGGLPVILAKIEQAAYQVRYKQYDAADFGAPHHRRRAIFFLARDVGRLGRWCSLMVELVNRITAPCGT
jgi:hypothetical protein